jgi:hypothetical protein
MAKPLKAVGKGVFGDTNKDTIRSGNWYGNDTTWRMVQDLNRILIYADKNGNLSDSPTRRIFCIVDGIVAGEGNGPLDPTPKQAGVIVAGRNLIAVDLTCARLMDFDYKRLPILYRSLEDETLPLFTGGYGDIICKSNNQQCDGALCEFKGINLGFVPHFGWKNHIELDK